MILRISWPAEEFVKDIDQIKNDILKVQKDAHAVMCIYLRMIFNVHVVTLYLD